MVARIFGRHPTLSVEGHLPSFDGATGWLNSTPLTPEGLRGKVVAVDFCTYTCINWLRTLPYVRAWADKYADHGLVTIGVHTPEFSVEHDVENVRRALESMRVTYPIALDNDYGVWNAFANHYWPALYLADAEGRIRHHWFGEGDYEGSEMVIQMLLGEAGHEGFERLVDVEGEGPEAPADWDHLRSGETYLGYRQATNFASPGRAEIDRSVTYRLPDDLRLNEWALAGDWTISGEAATSDAPGARIAFRFHARDVHLVMAPGAGANARPFRVALDGDKPGESAGTDIEPDGTGRFDIPRMYQLIRQGGPVEDRLFEIEFDEPGDAALCFTFG